VSHLPLWGAFRKIANKKGWDALVAKVDPDSRDAVLPLFRERIIEKMGMVPFPGQREWWLASEGLKLERGVIVPPDAPGASVRLPDGSIERWGVTARKQGRARFLSELGSFKVGKSWGAGMWAAAFAAIPGAYVSLVASEYDVAAPEFDYIVEALLSSNGLSLKYDSLQNRPRDGKMWLDLPNGVRYDCRSWERRESLKGKELDAYVFCEAYQLPGIECFTANSQNLRARRGYAVFATTPDRPWIKQLHELGHGFDPEWHCTCGVSADTNPFTFDATARKRDETLMTREKFAIHYMGQLGDFVGKVFSYERGTVQFNAETHPHLFDGGNGREHLRLPAGWEVVAGVDTGTFYTALAVAFSPEGTAFVIDEWPNYRYVAGQAERDEDLTIPVWAGGVVGGLGRLGARANCWADRNSQFKAELRNYGITLLPASAPVETRTEVTREYFQRGGIHLAPWLEVLPFELENAQWPDEATASGKFARVKDRDHTLDCLEHVLARRPQGKPVEASRNPSWLERNFPKAKPHRSLGTRDLGKY
jgi:hypothetical protein